MIELRKQLPDGVQDYMPRECAIKRGLEEKLRQELKANGFKKLKRRRLNISTYSPRV